MGGTSDRFSEDDSYGGYGGGWVSGKGIRRVGYNGNPRISFTPTNLDRASAAPAAASTSAAAHATSTSASHPGVYAAVNVSYGKKKLGASTELFST